MSKAQQLVDALLENVRVCAFCQKERGIRGQPGESHGFCRRHFMDHYSGMFTPEEIAAMSDESFSPDMEITNEKRPDMEKFYDDKAVAVQKNKGVSESVTKRAFLVTYCPKKGYRPGRFVCIIDGNFTPSQVTKLIRQGAEQLAGRRLSWSQGDLNIMVDTECDPEKARVAPGVAKVILNQDGSVQVLPA